MTYLRGGLDGRAREIFARRDRLRGGARSSTAGPSQSSRTFLENKTNPPQTVSQDAGHEGKTSKRVPGWLYHSSVYIHGECVAPSLPPPSLSPRWIIRGDRSAGCWKICVDPSAWNLFHRQRSDRQHRLTSLGHPHAPPDLSSPRPPYPSLRARSSGVPSPWNSRGVWAGAAKLVRAKGVTS